MVKKEPYIGMPIILGEYDNGHMKAQMAPGPVIVENPHANINECRSAGLEGLPIAMAYVPMQKWDKTYNLDKGLEVGTIFPELNLPFKGYQGGMA